MSKKGGQQPKKKPQVDDEDDGGDAGGGGGAGKNSGTKVKVRHILCEKVRPCSSFESVLGEKDLALAFVDLVPRVVIYRMYPQW